jgi:quercetin dioxygenase-like cupin family protein
LFYYIGTVDFQLAESDVAPEHEEDGGAEVRRLYDAERGCAPFSQRVLTFGAGASGQRSAASSDEVLYVRDGAATLSLDATSHALTHGSAVFVARGTSWSVDVPSHLDLLSVLIHDPLPATAPHAVVHLSEEATGAATAGRAFSLGATPEIGCASATQFVGFIPPGRAPDHFHKYDEVIFVLDGEGTLFIGGEEAPLHAGVSVHLPARLVHCLENTGDTTMHVLGIFKPAGSPAEAYYPDGTAAVVPGSDS